MIETEKDFIGNKKSADRIFIRHRYFYITSVCAAIDLKS